LGAEFSPSELERYDRQIRIKGWGVEGQRKVKDSTVVVCGAGGLGCPVSIYLTAAGVGHIRIIDEQKAELSNLNRQILHWQPDVGKFKAVSAAEKLRNLNPTVKIEPVVEKITEKSVGRLVGGADVVVDAMDNFTTRFVINEECVRRDTPMVHAGIYGLEGSMMTIIPRKGPCLRCLYPENPPEISPFPVLGATPGVFAMLEVAEALKLIVGIGQPLVGKLLIFDGLSMAFSTVEIKRDPSCKVCGGL